MENLEVRPPQYNNYDQISRAASASGDNNTPELKSAKGFAIASLICGIAGIIFSATYGIGALIGGVGLACSIIARKKGTTSSMKTVGMVLSIVAIAIGLIVGLIMISVLSWASSYNSPSFY